MDQHGTAASRQQGKRQISWTRLGACFFLINALIAAAILVIEPGDLVFELRHTLVGVFGVSAFVLLFILSCCHIPTQRIGLLATFGLCIAFYIFGIATDTIARRVARVKNIGHH